MNYDFSSTPCNQCGWCCRRTPCPLGLFLGAKPFSPCPHLGVSSQDPDETYCRLISDEKDPLKKEAAKEIVMAGKGCSHRYGPHPRSLVKDIMKKELPLSSNDWKNIIESTLKEYQQMMHEEENKMTATQIQAAIDEFIEFLSNGNPSH